jgi:DNA-binding beta-propeller fold protein YncE
VATAKPFAIPADSIKVSLGGETNGVTACAGFVWVAVHTETADGVAQVEPATGRNLGSIDGATNLACFNGEPWAAVDGAAIKHLDPVTRAVVASVAVEAFYVGAGAGSIWAPSGTAVVRIDPETATVAATIKVSPDADVTEVEGDDRAIWATVKEANTIYRIDPATNKVIAEIPGDAFAHGILVQTDAIWISNAHRDTVTRIDPTTNETVTIEGTGSGVGLAEGGGYVWASTRVDLFRIDPATNQATKVVHIGGWPYGIAFLDGDLWVGNGRDALYGIPIAALTAA